MVPSSNMRYQPGPSRLTLGLLALAVMSSVTMLAREIEPTTTSAPFTSSSYTPAVPSSCDWARHPLKYPVPEDEMARLPRGESRRLPQIQYGFYSAADLASDLKRDTDRHSETNHRQQTVKEAFTKTWAAYREHAWGCDELRPISQSCANHLNGWGASIVDSLDTLWIMGMHDEFQQAVDFVARIDWNNSTQSRGNPFEINAHYLGGLLSAFDLSQDDVLLRKAVELGDMLYATFDTPNHMPPFVFSFDDLRAGKVMSDPYQNTAVLGAMSLEFTRLAQLTGNDKYYDAVHRIKTVFAEIQGSTLLPGLWPEYINVRDGFPIPNNIFRMGGDNNALYDYLPKTYALLGGLDSDYAHMYRRAAATTRNNLLFRPMIPHTDEDAEPQNILFLGSAVVDETAGTLTHISEVDHTSCSLAGTFALAGRLLSRPQDIAIGESLARGCAWAHTSTPSGLMPENAHLLACSSLEDACPWDESQWLTTQQHLDCPSDHPLPRGYVRVDDPRALLRPETAESLFVLYRVTDKPDLQDAAWDIFSSMARNALTPSGDAFAALADVSRGGQLDEMRPFVTQTLKYLYLIFSDPGFMSLDNWVFSAEGHPFRKPVPG